MTFGRMLSRACDQQRISHYRFAQLLGVQQSRVPQILKAKNLTERTFKQAVKALGLELQVKLVRSTANGVGRRRAPGSGRAPRPSRGRRP